MADENNADVAANATPIDASVTAPAAKKTRKPRSAKVTSPAAVTSEAAAPAAPAKKTRAKRGSKTVAAAEPKATAGKPTSKVAAPARAVKAASASAKPLDDITSLLQLEEENKKLRKQLFDKLHAENSDLRKRLGKS